MALDPQVRPLVDQMNALLDHVGRDWTDPDVVRARTRAPVKPIEDRFPVASVADRAIPARDGHAIPIRVYKHGTGTLGVIVFFHGGGWVTGDLDSHDDICRRLAVGTGCVVVAVDYRRAPEHPFPKPLHDAADAISWVATASEFGGGRRRIVVAGDSSGGNLAAAAAILARDQGGPEIVLQVLVYPVLDGRMAASSYNENAEGFVLTARLMKWYWDQYAPGCVREDVLASPLRQPDLSWLPPALIVTADLDPLRGEGMEYAARLRAAGVEVTITNYLGAFHGFLGYGALMSVARDAFADVVSFIVKYMEATALDTDSRSP